MFFSHFCYRFALAKMWKKLPGFSISRLANVEDFFNVNTFFKLNINVSINDHSLYLCSILLETSFLLSHLFCNVDFELIRLIEFQNKTNIEIIGFVWVHNTFWIPLRFVKYRFMRYRFFRYWFRVFRRPWLDTDIQSKHFVCLQYVSKTSSRHVFKTCLQDVFKTSSA